jgi:hypothetical protein
MRLAGVRGLSSIITDLGEVLACRLPPAHVDERRPVPGLVTGLRGKVCGDRGSISPALFADLFAHGVPLVTKLRKDMKDKLLPVPDTWLLRNRSLIEPVNAQLETISQIEHSRHRSVATSLVNLGAGLIAYTYQEQNPALPIRMPQGESLPLVALSLHRPHVESRHLVGL